MTINSDISVAESEALRAAYKKFGEGASLARSGLRIIPPPPGGEKYLVQTVPGIHDGTVIVTVPPGFTPPPWYQRITPDGAVQNAALPIFAETEETMTQPVKSSASQPLVTPVPQDDKTVILVEKLGINIFRCNTCSETFNCRNSAYRHYGKEHNSEYEQAKKSRRTKLLRTEAPLTGCIHECKNGCTASFSDIRDLEDHNKRFHLKRSSSSSSIDAKRQAN